MIERALIIGAGPAGMTAAISLSGRGVRCELVELSEDWRPAGIGISLPNAPLRALNDLGLFDACVQAGRAHDAVYFCDPHGDVYASVSSEPLVPGPALVAMPRARLHEILQGALRDADVPVRLGVGITALRQDDDGADVSFSDGTTDRFDLVIGADGLHSQTRADHFPHAPKPRCTGQSCWRASAPIPEGVDGYYLFTSGNRQIGLVPIAEDRMYLWLLEPQDPDRVSGAAMRERLLEKIEGFGPQVDATAAVLEDDVDCRPLQALLMDAPWHNGRLVMAGDAVHCTTPQLAYGAGIAIEDAVVLGALVEQGLEGDELGEAYVARRFERCKLVVESSVQLGEWELHPPEDHLAQVKLMEHALAVLEQPI